MSLVECVKVAFEAGKIDVAKIMAFIQALITAIKILVPTPTPDPVDPKIVQANDLLAGLEARLDTIRTEYDATGEADKGKISDLLDMLKQLKPLLDELGPLIELIKQLFGL
jgi:hypothetical protein